MPGIRLEVVLLTGVLAASCGSREVVLSDVETGDKAIAKEAAQAVQMTAERCVLVSVIAGQEHYPVDDSAAMQLILKSDRPQADCPLGRDRGCDAALIIFFGVGVFVDRVDSGHMSLFSGQGEGDSVVLTVSGDMRFVRDDGRGWDVRLREVILAPAQLTPATTVLDGLAFRAPDVLSEWSRECGLDNIVGPRLGKEPRRLPQEGDS